MSHERRKELEAESVECSDIVLHCSECLEGDLSKEERDFIKARGRHAYARLQEIERLLAELNKEGFSFYNE